MFSDIVLKTQFFNTNTIHEKLLSCETRIRTKPTESISDARSAAEEFIKGVLDSNGIKIPKGIKAKLLKLSSAEERQLRCLSEGFITEAQSEALTKIRRSGNISVHEPGIKSNTHKAAEIFELLYKFIAEYITKEEVKFISPLEEKYPLFELLPIGNYEVIKPLFEKFSFDIIPSYLCRRVKKDGDIEMAIIRRFRLEEKEDMRHEREILASNEVRKNYTDVSFEPIKTEEIESSKDCRHRYLCYILGKNTFLMSEREKIKGLNLPIWQKLNIVYEIAETLYSLIDIEEGVSIHHRQLSPQSVFITVGRKNVHARVGFFEYAKIKRENEDGANPTVMRTKCFNEHKDDYYKPPEFRDQTIRGNENIDWEQVDVYSCAMLVFYVLFGEPASNADKEEKYLDYIEDKISFELRDVLERIITMPYGSRAGINELRKVLKREVARFEE